MRALAWVQPPLGEPPALALLLVRVDQLLQEWVTVKVSKLLVEVSLRIRGRYLVEPLQVEPLVLLMLGLLALDDVGVTPE